MMLANIKPDNDKKKKTTESLNADRGFFVVCSA